MKSKGKTTTKTRSNQKIREENTIIVNIKPKNEEERIREEEGRRPERDRESYLPFPSSYPSDAASFHLFFVDAEFVAVLMPC